MFGTPWRPADPLGPGYWSCAPALTVPWSSFRTGGFAPVTGEHSTLKTGLDWLEISARMLTTFEVSWICLTMIKLKELPIPLMNV